MLQYRDFVPQQLQAPRLGFSATAMQGQYEDLDAALAAANAWLSGTAVELVNVETVVLPNLWADWEQGTKDAALGGTSGSPSWHQFIRIWYREG
jgi:hypothetical protein